MTPDDILYTLITKMNLDFIIRRIAENQTHFLSSNYTVIYDDLSKTFKGLNSFKTEIVELPDLNIDALNKHYQLGIDLEIQALQSKIKKWESIKAEQKISRIPKNISNLIGYDYKNLKVVGGSELIYVHVLYGELNLNLSDIAVDVPLLKRYMEENEIVENVSIKFMNPDDYKAKFKISN